MNIKKNLPALAVLAAVLLVWKGAVVLFKLPPHVLPAPEVVAARLGQIVFSPIIWGHLATTMTEILIGFGSGVILGLIAGYALAKAPTVEKVLSPFILVFQTAPKISLAPLFVLWFGLGLTSKVVLIALVTFFPLMLNIMVGIRSVPPDYISLLRILHAKPMQRIFKVELMSALPYIMTGLRVALVLSVTAAIIGEMMGAKSGLGFLLMTGNEMYDIPLVLATILVISLLSWGLDAGMKALQNRLLVWHESST
ncbi:ABC transporter permease [Breznakiella homolactica]|uniref:ABC transporter permease n=1 Tax=Breznakiella homolactica TaxID=2798577 RepID=A0A7T7XQI2_9SPIR|nr:ABC transporter permease [Breznakiella homolactica]QQO10558.1 ABC transporter permease [Breznakiella homolactica]